MYGAIITLEIKDSKHTIIHAINEPVLTMDLLVNIIIRFCAINGLRFTIKEYENATVTVYNGETETTFAFKAKHISPIILREI